jgi:hypothetical protein
MSTPVTLPSPEELTATFGGEWKPDPWGRSIMATFGRFELHLRLSHGEDHFTFFVARARTLDFGFRKDGRDWRAIGLSTLAEFHAEAALLPKGAK